MRRLLNPDRCRPRYDRGQSALPDVAAGSTVAVFALASATDSAPLGQVCCDSGWQLWRKAKVGDRAEPWVKYVGLLAGNPKFTGRQLASSVVDSLRSGPRWRFKWALLRGKKRDSLASNCVQIPFQPATESRLPIQLHVFGSGKRDCPTSNCVQIPFQPATESRLPIQLHVFGSGKRDLNPRHRPWQGRALPLSYSRFGVTDTGWPRAGGSIRCPGVGVNGPRSAHRPDRPRPEKASCPTSIRVA